MNFDNIPNESQQGLSVKNESTLEPSREPASQLKFDEIPHEGEQNGQSPISFDRLPDESEKYKTTGQKIAAGLEGAASGVLGPFAPAAEIGLGISTPEEIRFREEVNPTIHGVGEAAGLVGSMFTGVGEAALLERGALAATEHLLPEVAGKIAQGTASRTMKMGSNAIRTAIEMMGYSGGDEISKNIIQDPNQTAESAIAHIGLSSALGAVGGAVFGALPSWTEKYGKNVEQKLTEFNNSVSGAIGDMSAAEPLKTLEDASVFGGLKKLKPDAQEVIKIGQENGLPVFPGMIGGQEVQQATDSLLKGPPTVASIVTRKEYAEAYDGAVEKLKSVTGANESGSEVEVGNALKNSFVSKLEKQYEPIKALYDEIEPYKQAIPISENRRRAMARSISKIAEEVGAFKGQGRESFIRSAAETMMNIDNLQKLANYRTELFRTAGPYDKDLAGKIAEKMLGVEERSIRDFASTMKTKMAKQRILQLADQSDAARSAYSQFRDKMESLGESIGKRKIYGAQDMMDFIEDMNPQTLATKTFSGRNIEFARYLSKEFPEEFNIIKDYQRKKIITDKLGKEANVKKVAESILKLPKEMQQLLYSPEELKTVNSIYKYLDSFPKSFNPSGTAHESAFRAFFEHPTGAAMANLRDYGIKSFIDAVGMAYPGAEKHSDKLIPVLGSKILNSEIKSDGFKSAVSVAINAIKATETLAKSSAALISGSVLDGIKEPTDKQRDDLREKVDHYSLSPHDLINMGDQVGHYLPNHSQSIAQATASAIQFLASQKPMPIKMGPLDTEIKPSKQKEMEYNRLLNIAQNPLVIMKHVKNGLLLPSDVNAIKTMYPSYYKKMSLDINSALIDHTSKGKTIPYKLRQPLSLLLGQPLDSTMTPGSIMSIQQMYADKKSNIQQSMQQKSGTKKKSAKLDKLASNMLTPEQKAEERHAKL